MRLIDRFAKWRKERKERIKIDKKKAEIEQKERSRQLWSDIARQSMIDGIKDFLWDHKGLNIRYKVECREYWEGKESVIIANCFRDDDEFQMVFRFSSAESFDDLVKVIDGKVLEFLKERYKIMYLRFKDTLD